MRDLSTELSKIIKFAEENDNIRALVLQGSFVNDNVEIDEFSDLDPLFYVKDLNEFINNNDWKTYFGKPISQFNDEGIVCEGQSWYSRLTIYEDGFKIDFGFESIETAKYANDMPLYKVFMDKDNIIPKPDYDDERKFYVEKPSEEYFLDRINTFFYDTSYVVKALARNEMFFVKYMEGVLQKKTRKLLDWYIGINNDFKVNTGVKGRYFRRYLDDDIWSMLLKTYGDGDRENCANALLASYDLVRYLGLYIADKLGFNYPEKHNQDMLEYCKKIINKYILK